MSKDIVLHEERMPAMNMYGSINSFEDAQRMAKALATSTLVPKEYQGNVSNAMVALEMAQRIGASPMAVMQNLDIIHGRPSWRSQFVIAALNSCGRFSALRFVMEGEGMTRACTAWATDRSGERLEGPQINMAMAKAEGWYDKSGSKWKTMPELMLRYRAAKFFGNLYAPDVLMGMSTQDEVEDFDDQPIRATQTSSSRQAEAFARLSADPVTPEKVEQAAAAVEAEAKPRQTRARKPVEQAKEPEPVVEDVLEGEFEPHVEDEPEPVAEPEPEPEAEPEAATPSADKPVDLF